VKAGMKNYIRKQKWLRRPPVLTQERDTQRGKTSPATSLFVLLTPDLIRRQSHR
jgi:hypothetical protein